MDEGACVKSSLESVSVFGGDIIVEKYACEANKSLSLPVFCSDGHTSVCLCVFVSARGKSNCL